MLFSFVDSGLISRTKNLFLKIDVRLIRVAKRRLEFLLSGTGLEQRDIKRERVGIPRSGVCKELKARKEQGESSKDVTNWEGGVLE